MSHYEIRLFCDLQNAKGIRKFRSNGNETYVVKCYWLNKQFYLGNCLIVRNINKE